MMGLAEIKAANRRNSRTARELDKQPCVPTAAQRAILATGKLEGIRIPSFGGYVPRGWKRTSRDQISNSDEPFFVDTSGFGAPGEPALTHEQFARELAKLPEGVGIALIEVGQFQCYIATYVQTKLRGSRNGAR